MPRKLTVAALDPNPRTEIEHRILTPIGVKIGSWRNVRDGAPLMPQGLVLAADEWARIGEFVRSGGTLNGTPLIDPATLVELFRGSDANPRSEDHTSELQSLMRTSSAVFCLKKKNTHLTTSHHQRLTYTPSHTSTPH